MTFKLSRRAVLRGAGATLGLPLLDAMLNSHGDALAQGAPLPCRFGLFFWGNGIGWGNSTTVPEGWVPAATGTGWVPAGQLAPLAAVKGELAVFTGFAIPGADQFPHHSGMCAVLSGKKWKSLGPVRDTMIGTFDAPTLDQQVAQRLAGLTPFRSLELGVTPKYYQADEGTTFNGLSHNGPSSMNFPEFSPRTVFDRLFGAGLANEAERQAKLSVLDSVKTDVNKLHARVGARDRLRLAQHLDSVRSIEMRLQTMAPVCSPGTRPVDVVDPPTQAGQLVRERNQLMAELLATALSCDLTRSFSYLFSYAGAGTLFSGTAATEGHHGQCHNEAAPQPAVTSVTTFIMDRLKDFVLALKARPEGQGTLLDSCAILCTSELSYGRMHLNSEFPLLTIGGGRGRLARGFHYRSSTGESPSAVTLALLRAVDPGFTQFGEGDYLATVPHSALAR